MVAVLVRIFPRRFFSEGASMHFWFMYPLIGMIVSTPFLAKLLQALQLSELKILVTVAFVWNIISVYCTFDFGVGFEFSGWILFSWMFQYVLGFCVKHQVFGWSTLKQFFIMCSMFFITVMYKNILGEKANNVWDLALAYILFTISVYSLLISIRIKENSFFARILQFLAKHSFTIYMIHMAVLNYIVKNTSEIAVSGILFALRWILCFVFSALIATAIDYCILYPLKKIVRRVIRCEDIVIRSRKIF